MSQLFDNSEMQQLVTTFLAEADEFIEEMEAGLLALEENSDDKGLIDQVFRAAHSLKGSSMAVGLTQVGSFTHELEALLLEVKEHRLSISPAVIGTLLKCNDHVKTMIEGLKKDLSATFDSTGLIAEISNFKSQKTKAPAPPAAFGFFEDDDKGQAEDDPDEHATKDHQNEANGHKQPHGLAARSQEQIKVSQEKIDRLVNNIGEMAILLTVLEEQIYQVAGTKLQSTVKQLYKISKDVQDVSISLRMLPVKPVFQKLKRIVRDVSTKLNKKVELHLIGEDFEVDKSILDMVSDPLVHIVRNAADHGIETPAQRIKAGKDPFGTITLEACHENGRLVFYIIDDGGGIDTERVKAKAVKLGLIDPKKDMPHDEIVNLIFHPGFSTKDQVTDISGRGVGMDVVKNNIQKMSGEIDIKTEKGVGSMFKITVPQTFSIIDGTVVQAANQRYVIPLADILESVRVSEGSLIQSTPVGQVFTLRGEKLPAFRLDELFDEHRDGNAQEQIAMIARTQDDTFAIIVDEILGRQPIVIKNLGMEMQDYKEFSGSTILGDGKPALIVELSSLIRRSAHKKKYAAMKERMSA
ncbi:MAG TPA: chemotaxis protein CheA [Oligoflexus sp.]|uniref:chemotaxis protein CheA n=1 Tax=Oligoflexus sp. TaxID=1971216 RepID=UPI002D80143D|nr:chemotaxis protein CheA [Oligoflexus sp.]HET9238924.1 chemotaxis protein CheA [Oligoflexus sp.]